MECTQQKVCFYCEKKALFSWKPAYIALLNKDALYLVPSNMQSTMEKNGGDTIPETDAQVFAENKQVLTYSAQNSTEYYSMITYDTQVPDWTPLNETESYCVISFRDSSGKKVTLRSRYTTDVHTILCLANQAFSKSCR